MSNGILPPSLVLASVPPEAPKAYKRKIEMMPSNNTSFNPGSNIQIYFETSTPGAMLDPTSAYLKGVLTISNKNYCVDFSNWTREGIMGRICQQLKIYNQGTPLEEIDEYGTVASSLAMISGDYQYLTSFYFSNRLKVSYQTQCHKCMIKPAMCDANGNIMYGSNSFGLGVDVSGNYSGQYFSSYLPGNPAMSCQSTNNAGFVGVLNPSNTPLYQKNDRNCMSAKDSDYALTIVKDYTTDITPMDWPTFYNPSNSDPILTDYISNYGSINKPMVMAHLVNVKCFPIGMIPSVNAYQQTTLSKITAVNLAAQAANTAKAPTEAKIQYTFCAPIISGFFGTLANKMIPATVMSPQQCYLNIQLADPYIALQVSSDPLRRIPGTIRDYIRNIGQQNNTLYGNLTTTNPTASIVNNIYDFGAGTLCAPGYNLNTGISLSYGQNCIFNGASATGQAFLSNASYLGTIDLAGGAFVVVGNNMTYTIAANQVPAFQPCIGMILTGTNFVSTCVGCSMYYSSTTIANIYRMYFDFPVSLGVVSVYVPSSQIPKNIAPYPQYIIATEPWKFVGSTTASTAKVIYANDTQVFYGCCNPYSVPQIARIFDLDYSNSTSKLKSATLGTYNASQGAITYSVSNIALCIDQYILPDQVTAEVVLLASQGGFNVFTSSVRTFQVSASAGQATQTLILPIKITQALKLLIAFQPNVTRSQDFGWFYDSNCSYNIFGAITEPADKLKLSIQGYANGSDTLKTLYGVGYKSPLQYFPTTCEAISNNMSVQLQIGAEYYPPAPITSMVQLATEFNKTIEGYGNGKASVQLDSLVTYFSSVSGDGTTAPTMIYDCLVGDKYTSIFTHHELLDDQTIMNNNDWAPLYCYSPTLSTAASSATIKNAAATQASSYNGYNWLAPRGFCLTDKYVPQSSSFLLGFNLTTFETGSGLRSYTYLGNNTITLQLKGAVGLQNDIAGITGWRLVCMVPHLCVVRYMPGGNILWIY